ncbi:type II secretion system protein [Colwelliaceae bacterium BS250]
MNNNKGFTLIELVIVIVILGILAATAAPKFIDLTGDARESVMSGLEGSIQSAVEISHAKALIEGQTGPTGAIQIGADFYAMENGWPAAVALGDGSTDVLGLGIEDLLEIDTTLGTGDFTATEGVDEIEFTHQGATVPASCIITYNNSINAEERPLVTSDLTDC